MFFIRVAQVALVLLGERDVPLLQTGKAIQAAPRPPGSGPDRPVRPTARGCRERRPPARPRNPAGTSARDGRPRGLRSVCRMRISRSCWIAGWVSAARRFSSSTLPPSKSARISSTTSGGSWTISSSTPGSPSWLPNVGAQRARIPEQHLAVLIALLHPRLVHPRAADVHRSGQDRHQTHPGQQQRHCDHRLVHGTPPLTIVNRHYAPSL